MAIFMILIPKPGIYLLFCNLSKEKETLSLYPSFFSTIFQWVINFIQCFYPLKTLYNILIPTLENNLKIHTLLRECVYHYTLKDVPLMRKFSPQKRNKRFKWWKCFGFAFVGWIYLVIERKHFLAIHYIYYNIIFTYLITCLLIMNTLDTYMYSAWARNFSLKTPDLIRIKKVGSTHAISAS